MEYSGNIPIFNIPGTLFRNIPRKFIRNFFRIHREYIIGMFHEYSTNIYLPGGLELLCDITLHINFLLINGIFWSSLLWKSKEWTHANQSISQVFLLCLKRNNSQTFKSIATAKKPFSLVYMLSAQLALINSFYSMWQLEDNVSYKSLLLPWGSFQPPCSCVVWNTRFEISPYFNFYLHNTNTKVKAQCKYQSSKIKLSYAY